MTTTTDQLTPAESEAAALIERVYTERGRGTLSCAYCGMEAYIDAEAVGCYADTVKVAELIASARYDHISPAAILFDAPVVVLDLAGTR